MVYLDLNGLTKIWDIKSVLLPAINLYIITYAYYVYAYHNPLMSKFQVSKQFNYFQGYTKMLWTTFSDTCFLGWSKRVMLCYTERLPICQFFMTRFLNAGKFGGGGLPLSASSGADVYVSLSHWLKSKHFIQYSSVRSCQSARMRYTVMQLLQEEA